MTVKPPAWVTGGPDKNGAYPGPAVHVEPSGLSVYTSWSPKAGAVAWMDNALYKGTPLSVTELDKLSGALQAARARVVKANKKTTTLDVTRVTRIKVKTEVSIWPADGDHDYIGIERETRQAPGDSIQHGASALLDEVTAAVMAKVVAEP